MRCPNCGNEDLKVIDSRAQIDSIKRRRACIECMYRFTTFERIEKRYPIVRKKDGTFENFIPQKIQRGLENAFRKRKVVPELFEQLLIDIDLEIAAHTSPEIGSDQIGQIILHLLQRLDLIAYIRFASVYCEVETMDDFLDLLPAQYTLEKVSEGV